jgi:hypothetical protein
MKFYIFIISLIGLLSFNCFETIEDPVILTSPENSICYTKSINCRWSLCLNSLSGSHFKNITNDKQVDAYPASISADGKRVIFALCPLIFSYDIETDKITNLSTDFPSASQPAWSPGGNKIIYQYRNTEGKYFTYTMNPDGSGKKKVLDCGMNPYFLSDNFRFIYLSSSILNGEDNKIYLADLNGTNNEFVLDTKQIGNAGLSGFNPKTNDILFMINNSSNLHNVLATYNLYSHKIDTLSAAGQNWVYTNAKYSNDYSKIVISERNYDENVSVLSILENRNKREILRLTGKDEWIDFNPMAFSPRDKYLAYSKNIDQPGDWACWKSYLYVIDINSKVNYYVDEGKNPVWNPAYNE